VGNEMKKNKTVKTVFPKCCYAPTTLSNHNKEDGCGRIVEDGGY
jgi:hypothetical protein